MAKKEPDPKGQAKEDGPEPIQLDDDDLQAISHILRSVAGKNIDLVKEARKVGRNRDGDLVWIPSEDWRPLVQAAQGLNKPKPEKPEPADSKTESADSKPDDTEKAEAPPKAEPQSKPVTADGSRQSADPPKIREYRINRVDGPKKSQGEKPSDYQSLVAQREAWETSGEKASSRS